LAPEKICARHQSTRRNQKKPENAGRDPKVGKVGPLPTISPRGGSRRSSSEI
jgi:ribosome assembly protein YihI (activator of Der GTPase)